MDPRKLGWIDAALLLVAVLAGARVWGDCAGAAEVAGDSFVPLQCGLRFLEQGWALPSQSIFGWGLCATFAPLFLGAESIWDVAIRRAFAASWVVPCAWVTVRLVLPAMTSLSVGSVRIGASLAALAVLASPGVGIPSSSGGHGYLSWTWAAVALAAFAFAVRPGRPTRADRLLRVLATCLGAAGVAMAPMNHPFAAWLAVAALALAPLGAARAGWIALGSGAAVAFALARPRLDVLRDKAAAGDSFDSFAHQPGSARLLEPENLLAWLGDGPDGVLIVGFGLLVVLAAPLAGGDRGRRLAAASWVVAALASLTALVLLGRRVGYLQPYHVLVAHPFAAIGIGLATGALAERAARWGRPAVAVLTAALALGVAEGSDLDEPERPWSVPWCSIHPRNGGTAYGVAQYQAAIEADLAGGAPERFLITDLNLTDRSVDGSVVLGLSLHLGGVAAERMACCATDADAPAWYMIADLYDPRIDWNRVLRLDGIDPVLHRPDVSELLFAVRTPAGLDALGDVLCEAIPPDQEVRVHHHEELIAVLFDAPLPHPPPSPTPPCIRRSQ